MRSLQKFALSAVVAVVAWQSLPVTTDSADAEYGWNGRRQISYQYSKDLFYNQYVAPGPSGVPAAMYVSPQPVPAHVGHTYGTYQPFYPNEYLYKHQRSYYNYAPGAGWTRTTARYGTKAGWWVPGVMEGGGHVRDFASWLEGCMP